MPTRKPTPTPKPTDDPGDVLVMPPVTGPESIYVLMGRILNDLPAIGKNRDNSEQHFKFRGIDDVLEYINPLFSAYGVFPAPHVLERVREYRTTRNGNANFETSLHVEYTFYGPAGDSITADAWGEGVDTGDKGTNKAMTNAMKNVLNQVFVIATKEVADLDLDRSTPEASVPQVFCSMCKEATGTDVYFPAPSVDPDPIREHYVTAHGYVRDPETGKVAPPPQDAAPDTSAPAAPTPAAEPSPEPPQGPQDAPVTPTAPTAPAAADVPDMDDVTPPGFDEAEWAKIVRETQAMKVSALAEQCGKLNLPKDGTKSVLVTRLLEFYAGSASAADEAPAEPEPEPEPAATEAPASDPSEAETLPYQCPDCDVFPFRTVEEYEEHWVKAHGDDGDEAAVEAEAEGEAAVEAEAEVASDEPADAVMVEALVAALGELKNQSARAYADYRRKAKLPNKPADMTAAQVEAALDFIDALPA